jgi:hypothetical protein
MKRNIPVRVVRVREARVALGGATALLGFITTMAMISDQLKLRSPDVNSWVLIGAVTLWTLGPLLSARPKPITGVTQIDAERGVVRIGKEEIPLYGPGVSVAKGERGYSIAVMNLEDEPLFIEVDTEKDARAFLESIGVGSWPGDGSLEVMARNEGRNLFRRALSVASLVALVLSVFLEGVASSAFGIFTFAASLIALSIFMFDAVKGARRFTLGDNARADSAGVPTGKGIVEQHIRAHLQQRVVVKEEEEEAAVSGASGGAHRRLLENASNESTKEWLARIDALRAGEGDGYRGGGPTAEELRGVLDDASSPPRAKLAAVRLLKRKFKETDETLKARIASVDDALGPSVRVVLSEDDADAAADELDAIGPAFRPARRQ